MKSKKFKIFNKRDRHLCIVQNNFFKKSDAIRRFFEERRAKNDELDCIAFPSILTNKAAYIIIFQQFFIRDSFHITGCSYSL